MTTGTIAKWVKKEGDEIAPGDVIAEVETDKAAVDYEAQDEGFLAKILVAEGSTDLEIGAPLAILVESKDDVAAFANYVHEASAAPPAPAPEPAPAPAPGPSAPAPPAPAPAAAPAAGVPPGGRIFVSPLARTVAAQHGVDVERLRGRGTGPVGRVIRADVEDFLAEAAQQEQQSATGAPAAAAAGGGGRAFRDVPVSGMRRVIAERLTESKQTVPHYYLTVDVELDELLAVRRSLNEDIAGSGARLSVNDFLLKASALAMREVPAANSSWLGDVIREHDFVDISVAVSVGDGLITPVVRDVDRKGLLDINAAVTDLARRARDRALAPEEYQGGTFTVSNLGMYGVKSFSAIINPPQACILAVGAAERRVLPVAAGTDEDEEQYRFATGMSVTLSCDHRVVDGAVGAQWLQAFKKYVEQPLNMLL